FTLELTSIAALLAAFPVAMLVERRFPLTAETWKRSLVSYAAASILFSAVHIGIMILLRKLAFGLAFGLPYAFVDDFVHDTLYEYRKDLIPYAAIIAVLCLVRQVEESRLEAAAARADARDTGRLTLKSGGRTIYLDARTFDWAEAAGNYVEAHAGGRIHLARISLSALTEQLADAGVDVAQIHRSRIVNRARIEEVLPSGDGDFRIRLRGGTELRGSRRYRLVDKP
ncbi:MAG TPA: LytTR family DNA-binding domain-containing protein, partial [Rhizobiaceae bacterium]